MKKRQKINVENIVYAYNGNQNDLYDEIKQNYEIGNFKKSMLLSLIGYKTFGDIKDQYGHPKFIKEAYRSAVEIPNKKKAQKIKYTLKSRLPHNDPCAEVFEARFLSKVGDKRAEEMWRKLDKK